MALGVSPGDYFPGGRSELLPHHHNWREIISRCSKQLPTPVKFGDKSLDPSDSEGYCKGNTSRVDYPTVQLVHSGVGFPGCGGCSHRDASTVLGQ